MSKPKCWICGNRPITKHHVIPQVYEPKQNIKINLCSDCHVELHSSKLQVIGTRKKVNQVENIDELINLLVNVRSTIDDLIKKYKSEEIDEAKK